MGQGSCSLSLSRGLQFVDLDNDQFELTAENDSFTASTVPSSVPFYFYIYPRKKHGTQSTYVDSVVMPHFQGVQTVKLSTKTLKDGNNYVVKWFHGTHAHGTLLATTYQDFGVYSSRDQRSVEAEAERLKMQKKVYDKAQKEANERMLAIQQEQERLRQWQLEQDERKRKREQEQEIKDYVDREREREYSNKKQKKLDHTHEMEAELQKIVPLDRRIFMPYFDLIDNDANGEISFEELYFYFNKVGAFSRTEVKDMMSEADVNHDGVIKLDEFISIMKMNGNNRRASKSKAWDDLYQKVRQEYNDSSPRFRTARY